MAVEQLIKKGDNELEEKDLLSAIESYTKAISENPKAFKAYIKRAIAYQRAKNYSRLKTDLSEAFALAQERGKRAEMGDCYFRFAIVYYSEKQYKLALKNFQKAEEYGSQEPALPSWKMKCEREMKKVGEWKEPVGDEEPEAEGMEKKDQAMEEKEGKTVLVADAAETKVKTEQNITSNSTESAKSTSIEAINKHAPLNQKIREDWYQTNEEVVITIYVKDVKRETLNIEYHENSVTVSFPSGPGTEYNYNLDPLYGGIDPNKSEHAVKSTKIEITLVKTTPGKWPSLERSSSLQAVVNKQEPSIESINKHTPLEYPTSSKKSINWSNFSVDEEEEDTSDPNAFFAKLYKDVDDDTRRAMMKSYIESNGTELTTDWNDAKKKNFKTSPPEGMEAKHW